MGNPQKIFGKILSFKTYTFRMSDSSKNELLEPTGISSSSILNICGPKESVQKPKIGEFPKESDTLSRVKSFLPKLKLAENELKRKIEQGQNVDIEDIGENDSKHIETNVEMFEQKQQWSEVSFLSYFSLIICNMLYVKRIFGIKKRILVYCLCRFCILYCYKHVHS